MKTKRGKEPSLISGSSGKPSKVCAAGQRHCTRCSDAILAGQECFEVPKIGGGFSSKKTFCIGCFVKLIEKTKRDITALESLIVGLV